MGADPTLIYQISHFRTLGPVADLAPTSARNQMSSTNWNAQRDPDLTAAMEGTEIQGSRDTDLTRPCRIAATLGHGLHRRPPKQEITNEKLKSMSVDKLSANFIHDLHFWACLSAESLRNSIRISVL